MLLRVRATATLAGDEVEVFTFGGRPAIGVRVSPAAGRTRVQGALSGRLKVQIAAQPEKGRANAGVTRLLAAALGVEPRSVVVVAGRTSRDKVIAFTKIDETALRERLRIIVGGDEP